MTTLTLSTLWFIVLVADADEYLRGRTGDESTTGAAGKTGRPDRDQSPGLTGGTSALSFSCLLPFVVLRHRVPLASSSSVLCVCLFVCYLLFFFNYLFLPPEVVLLFIFLLFPS